MFVGDAFRRDFEKQSKEENPCQHDVREIPTCNGPIGGVKWDVSDGGVGAESFVTVHVLYNVREIFGRKFEGVAFSLTDEVENPVGTTTLQRKSCFSRA